ncbi:MAG: prephenate dehydratase [Chitinophagaceae bacterium]|nr:prephenate dehydratase [Chitinophagaceae bacterium]
MSKSENKEMRFAIQGYEGSFHHLAAEYLLGKQVKVIPCDTFREVVKTAAVKKLSDGAVMAIENSIAGSILSNYNLLHKSNLKIAGELYLQIKHHLLANPGVRIEDIREVHSHTMALQQCNDFLEKYPWKLVETEDTALSARHIHQHKSKHIAAIAGKLAAELYGLNILVANIHSSKHNYTRFLLLRREEDVRMPDQADKASVMFHTNHTRGSLAKVLVRIANRGINLSKLQSFPIPGTDFKYAFHADLEFETLSQFHRVIEDIKPVTENIKVYGIYKKGLWK